MDFLSPYQFETESSFVLFILITPRFSPGLSASNFYYLHILNATYITPNIIVASKTDWHSFIILHKKNPVIALW